LAEVLRMALKPLIDWDALRIVTGGAEVGEYLTGHPKVEELHITGAGDTHDAIIWGQGEEGRANKAAGTPKNTRRITSELGAVCPTIVVPGPWTPADIQFQAEHIATQKMHNSGFNCVACQTLILPGGWGKGAALMEAVTAEISKATRPAYYPDTSDRLADFAANADKVVHIDRKDSPAALLVDLNGANNGYQLKNEVFAPALGIFRIRETDPATYLEKAIAFANENLHGTLGSSILIHPATIRKIGKKRFEQIIAGLHYGTIAINAWTGLGFSLTQCPWGAFPGHTLDDVQSGVGFVHNTFMFDRPERVVVSAPWRPFPRSLFSGEFALLPKPPWFITNKSQHKIGKALARFQHSPGWRKLPRIFLGALTG
ncbi:MAG: aldehyde dehydrogenase family protein, partial [Rhodobacteraceae bacterium]|nr:aldehyde dehydrogenase family protein [Paracoccaceae bacterium]